MRKIEQQMIAAIRENRDWKCDNTEVIYNPETGWSHVYLHGNHIATVDDTSVTIWDGGYQSSTTKSRLNAICGAFCIQGEGIFQRNFKWFVHQFVAQAGTSPVFVEKEFSNGFVFA